VVGDQPMGFSMLRGDGWVTGVASPGSACDWM
jgi:hypothetical protein